MDLFVVSGRSKYGISCNWAIIGKGKTSHELMMGINLEDRPPLWYIPEYDFTICTSRYHLSQIVSVFGHDKHSICMLVKCMQEWFCKYLLEFCCIKRPFVLSSLLKRVHICIRRVPMYSSNFIIGLLFIFLFISAVLMSWVENYPMMWWSQIFKPMC